MTPLQSKNVFIASISHEIRNPLQAILFSLDNLELMHVCKHEIEIINDIRNSVNLLSSIIGDILDMSKIEAGKMNVTLENVNLIHVVEAALDMNAHGACEKNLFLASYFDLQLPEIIRGDSSRIIQILSNFISNSIKYTTQGKVTVRIVKMEIM